MLYSSKVATDNDFGVKSKAFNMRIFQCDHVFLYFSKISL